MIFSTSFLKKINKWGSMYYLFNPGVKPRAEPTYPAFTHRKHREVLACQSLGNCHSCVRILHENPTFRQDPAGFNSNRHASGAESTGSENPQKSRNRRHRDRLPRKIGTGNRDLDPVNPGWNRHARDLMSRSLCGQQPMIAGTRTGYRSAFGKAMWEYDRNRGGIDNAR